MLKFTQFCKFQRALGKISAFNNCSSGISGSFSYKIFHIKEKHANIPNL